MLLVLFSILFLKEGKKKIHLSAGAELSKFEYSTRVFQKTVNLGERGNHIVKVLKSSPLITTQDLLFQSMSSNGTSQQGTRTQPNDGVYPSGSTGVEEVNVELPRTT